jgi:hypothetical protein
MCGIVLQQNQHQGRESDNPEKVIAIERTGRNIRGPVTGIYETYRNEKPRANILEYIAGSESWFMSAGILAHR